MWIRILAQLLDEMRAQERVPVRAQVPGVRWAQAMGVEWSAGRECSLAQVRFGWVRYGWARGGRRWLGPQGGFGCMVVRPGAMPENAIRLR